MKLSIRRFAIEVGMGLVALVILVSTTAAQQISVTARGKVSDASTIVEPRLVWNWSGFCA